MLWWALCGRHKLAKPKQMDLLRLGRNGPPTKALG